MKLPLYTIAMPVSNKNLYFTGLMILIFIISFPGCAGYRHNIERSLHKEAGIASWYGPGFHGRRMANGKAYNQNAMTAAHRGLPFGTSVKVTNVDNNKSVVVKITDRGPYTGRRVIDLSRAAAKELGFIRVGTARVVIEEFEGEGEY